MYSKSLEYRRDFFPLNSHMAGIFRGFPLQKQGLSLPSFPGSNINLKEGHSFIPLIFFSKLTNRQEIFRAIIIGKFLPPYSVFADIQISCLAYLGKNSFVTI